MSREIEKNRIFLICSREPERIKELSNKIREMIQDSTIYEANEGMDALFKIDNVPPHVVLMDKELPKLSGLDVTARILKNKKFENMSCILLGSVPEKEYFIDQVVSGRVQFVDDQEDSKKFNDAVMKALNFVSFGEAKGYKILFLNEGKILFNEGEQGDSVYLIKKGELEASTNSKGVLGKAKPGEFIGEMSHFNHEPRSATIKALGDCELIQIPFGALDAVLFSKPAWSKALIQTLSKRLKTTIHQ